jgi:UDP-N-acetylglucosamine--N-acetylmuramyl-(pentapeptide) pyrophosphoryl-undecaprenol N-acetylglucosamine transferase
MRVIISGGGTGGHIFPAVAIASEIKHRHTDAKILFVGAQGKMEMEKVPKAGYSIVGLPIAGFNRSNMLANLSLPFKMIKSFFKAYKLIKDFQPDIVIGVGGFASGPTLAMASLQKKKTLIQEQNSFAGITNKWVSKYAQKICVAYPNMQRFFEAEKIVFTGNPVRKDIYPSRTSAQEARQFFKLDPDRKTLLVIGGSLGARSINVGIQNMLNALISQDVQIIWQTGKNFIEQARSKVEALQTQRVFVSDFIYDMHEAYAAADIVLSRAGALSVSEIAVLGKTAVLVPYPFAAEDHQTENAKALVEKSAALMIADAEIEEKLETTLMALIHSPAKSLEISKNLMHFAKPQATEQIVDIIEKIVKS